jgi:hypothetical protein
MIGCENRYFASCIGIAMWIWDYSRSVCKIIFSLFASQTLLILAYLWLLYRVPIAFNSTGS